ncbi:MAG: hypothetical protein QXP98_02600 [Thermoproteus sp.]
MAIYLLGKFWDGTIRSSVGDSLTYLAASLLLLSGKRSEAMRLLARRNLAAEEGLRRVLGLCRLAISLYGLGVGL